MNAKRAREQCVQKLLAEYELIWRRPWPHETEYANELYAEAPRRKQKRRVMLDLLRECHEFEQEGTPNNAN